MNIATTKARTEAAPAQTVATTPVSDPLPAPEPPPERFEPRKPMSNRIPSIIVAIVITAVATLSIYYLVRGEPLLVQGEVDATQFDIAARVDGRVGDVLVTRGQNVAANAVLVRIDNPETLAKHEQALAAKIVADAQLANIKAGTRAEVIAARKAALERAQAALVLAQQTHERVRQAEHNNAPQARLDQAIDGLRQAERAVEQAKSTYEQAVNGYTREEREIAVANVGKALAERQCRSIDRRSDGGVRAGGLAGLPAERGARRICIAWGAAGHTD